MNKKMFFLILVILVITGCKQADPQQDKQLNQIQKWVSAKSGLRLRSEANTSSNTIVLIPDGQQVEVITGNKKNDEIILAGVVGSWVNVKWKNQTGWGFDGFLMDNKNDAQQYKYRYIPDKLIGIYEAELKPDSTCPPLSIRIGKKNINYGSCMIDSQCYVNGVSNNGSTYIFSCAETLTEEEKKEMYTGVPSSKTIEIIKYDMHIIFNKITLNKTK